MATSCVDVMECIRHRFKEELESDGDRWPNSMVELGGGDSCMSEQLRLRLGRSRPFPRHHGSLDEACPDQIFRRALDQEA